MAKCYFLLNHINRSITNFQASIKLNSKSLKAYIGLGKAYVKQKKYELAIQTFQDALDVQPEGGSRDSELK